MTEFKITFILIAIMLLCAIPGYILIKSKAIKEGSISAFSKVLMFICQPALTLYSFNKTTFSKELGLSLFIFFILISILQITFIGLFYLVFHKKMKNVLYRIACIATTLSNCSFLGVPLLEALYPNKDYVAAFSMMYFLSMSLIGWTIVSSIITQDKKYISVKKMLLNPATISIAISLPLFLMNFHINSEKGIFCAQIEQMITILGKMSTPLCMIIMGMRLATIQIKELFTHYLQYLVVFINQIIFPLFVLLVLNILNISDEIKDCMFIMCACPIASVVQNYSEIYQNGQKFAANVVLLGAIFSIITLPLLALLI